MIALTEKGIVALAHNILKVDCILQLFQEKFENLQKQVEKNELFFSPLASF